MLLYICAECDLAMRPHKIGVIVIERDCDGSATHAWHADKWACPNCGKKIIVEFGDKPVSEHGNKDFEDYMAIEEHSFYHSEVIPCQHKQ